MVSTRTGLRVWSRGGRAAPAALLAHIVVRREPVGGPDIPAALEPALTLAVPIAIALAHPTRPKVPTVVYVPILSSFGIGFTHIIVRRKPVIGPDILATPESTLALTVSITIALAYFTRSKISTVVHMPVLTSFWIIFTYIIVCPESVKCPDISAAIETILALTVAIAITLRLPHTVQNLDSSLHARSARCCYQHFYRLNCHLRRRYLRCHHHSYLIHLYYHLNHHHYCR